MDWSKFDPYIDSVASFLALLFIQGLLFRVIRERKPHWLTKTHQRYILFFLVGIYYGLWGIYFTYSGAISHNPVIYINLRMNILLLMAVFFGRIALTSSYIMIIIGRLWIVSNSLANERYIIILTFFYLLCLAATFFKVSSAKKYLLILLCALPGLYLYYFTSFNSYRTLTLREGLIYTTSFFFSSTIIFFAARYIRYSNEVLMELQSTATIDSLTRLKNSHHFNQQFETNFREALLKQENLSLLLIDIDHFKKINDSFGHQAGNLVLREIGTILKNRALPVQAVAARVGGEEFAILLPKTKQEEARQIAESIRHEIFQAVFPHQPFKHSVSVSIGVASLFQQDVAQYKTQEAFFEAADELLYLSKKRGRNSVSAQPFTEKGELG
ncbi:GGDEF domain-containing protein [Listeria valentina]|uniref:GGDEF domain-containing protein n=1 Tax=Listeria valentina TaxID=2705293 RepID=UPI00142FDA92|nr:GGDEF domain-containing protein [Listeria valentina]